MPVWAQVVWLLLLAIPVASITWTITHEEVFREPRDFCKRQSQTANHLFRRKFFYLFTCEYCFSHYVSAILIAITGFQLLLTGWRGYLITFFSLPWVANIYIGLFGKVKLGVKKDRVEIQAIEDEIEDGGTEKYPRLERPAA